MAVCCLNPVVVIKTPGYMILLIGSGFSVAFDPLDGSSIVDTNFTVGTIFGAWPGSALKGIKGSDQV